MFINKHADHGALELPSGWDVVWDFSPPFLRFSQRCSGRNQVIFFFFLIVCLETC